MEIKPLDIQFKTYKTVEPQSAGEGGSSFGVPLRQFKRKPSKNDKDKVNKDDDKREEAQGHMIDISI